MNLCRNIAVVVGFFLAFTLSLPLTMGAVEYPSAIGPQSVVVLTVEFSDEKPRYYPPVSQVEGLIFGMVNDYYQEVSYGQIFFEGYVTRKFYQIGSMDYYEGRGSPTGGQNVHIVADAILAADEDVDYSAYRHVIVVLIIPLRVREMDIVSGGLYVPLQRPPGGDERRRNCGERYPSAGKSHTRIGMGQHPSPQRM